MAKYDVKMSCGHVVTLQLFGKMTDRDKKIAWLEKNGVCSECQKADAAAKAKAENLPELTGTEKQINWALKIRSEILEKLEKNFAAQIAKQIEDGDTTKAEESKLQLQAVKNVLFQRFTDSNFWIDNRDNSLAVIIRNNNLKDAILAEIVNLK